MNQTEYDSLVAFVKNKDKNVLIDPMYEKMECNGNGKLSEIKEIKIYVCLTMGGTAQDSPTNSDSMYFFNFIFLLLIFVYLTFLFFQRLNLLIIRKLI